ncbi:MAG: cytochrome c3 family protein [Planctomycetota bacterium]|jgi:hypothetical protein
MTSLLHRCNCFWVTPVVLLLLCADALAVQFARPNGTVSAGSWTPVGDATLHETVDETTPNDDTDYMTTGASTTAELTLSGVTDPGVVTGHVIRFRFLSLGAGGPERCQVELYEGATTLIASTATEQSRDAYSTFAYTLSTAEATNIGDYGNLRFRIISSSVGGGEEVRVTWAEFEVPDAPVVNTPTVANPSIAAVEDVTATLGGEVTDIGATNVTERGVYWSTTQGFTPPGQGTKASTTGTWSAPFTFTEDVIDLPEAVLVYFQAFATNSDGDGFSSEASLQMEPATPASLITFPVIDSNTLTISWTAGSGTGAIVVMKLSTELTVELPVDGTEHAFDTNFGTLAAELGVGSGNYVVYRGAATTVDVTGLAEDTSYDVTIYEYAGSGTGVTGINYQQDAAPSASESTAIGGALVSHNALRNIQCDQCHAIHDTLVPRDLAQETVCKACHNATQMGAENTNLWDVTLHTVNGGATTIDCGSCHAVHNYDFNTDNTSHGGVVAENIARIRWDTSKYVPGALEPAIFQQRPQHFAFAESAFPTGPFNGICQSCHTTTTNHTKDGIDADSGPPPVAADNNHEVGGNCMTCHAHGGGFQATGCTGCHNAVADNGDGGPTRRAVVAEFSLASHHVDGATLTDNDCEVCHYEAIDTGFHQNNLVDLRDPDTGSRIPIPSTGDGFAKFTRDRGSDALEEWITTIQNDFCLKCHDGGVNAGATATYNADDGGTPLRPFSSTTRDVPNVFDRFDPLNSFHHAVREAGNNPYTIPSGVNGGNITMEAPWNQDATGGPFADGHDVISCFDCHGSVVTDPDGTTNLISAHGSANQRMLRTPIDLDGVEAAGAAADIGLIPANARFETETFCTLCHAAAVYVSSSDSEGVGSIFEYHGQSQSQHSASGGNELGCMGCHAGIVDFSAGLSDNGAMRQNLHGDSFTWPGDAFSAGVATEYFMLGGWLSGWETDATTGYCRGGDCNHRNSSKNYTR